MMKIEIPDSEAQTILAGLRSGESTIISSVADLLEKELEKMHQYPFEVWMDGEHREDYSSLEAVKREWSQAERWRIRIYDRVHGVEVSDW